MIKTAYILLCFIVCTGVCDNYFFVAPNYPPLMFKDKNNEMQGLAVDIVKKVMHNLGHTVDIKIYPWARALFMVKEGKADGVFTIYITEERKEFLLYPTNVLVPQIVYFYTYKGSNITFDGNLQSIKDKTIGALIDFSYGGKFDSSSSFLNIEYVSRLEQNFTKLDLKRVDLVPCNIYVGDMTLKEMKYTDKIVRLPIEIEAIPSYVAFSKTKKTKQLLKEFDKELGRMIESGEYGELLKTYNIDMEDYLEKLKKGSE